VLLLAHANRLSGENSVRDRLGATAALRQKARMLLFAATESEDDVGTNLYIGPDKVNTTSRKKAVRFDLSVQQVRPPTDDDPGACVVLDTPSTQDATISALMVRWWEAQHQSERRSTAAERAAEWLVAYITEEPGEDHKYPASVVLERGLRACHSDRSMRSALRLPGGFASNNGTGTPWWWTIPAQTLRSAP
jgi:hypothetical protein